jgi:hypothetical protein
MPQHIPFDWKAQGLNGKTKDTGWRRVLPIPFFTGSLPSFRLVIHNSLDRDQEVEYQWTLKRLYDINQKPESVAYGKVSLGVRKQSKAKSTFSTEYLARDGSYQLDFELKSLSNDSAPLSASETGIYFDALLRDATLTHWRINILMLILSAIVGGIAGWLMAHI